MINKVLDPVFIGYTIDNELKCSAKACAKVSPEEAVGVFCVRGGKYDLVEYSELP